MSRTILIVDDNVINRRLLGRLLADEYDVLEAADGKEALETLEREHERISAVLLDLEMPVMGGFEVLARMREKPELKVIPVVVTTGNTDEETEARALRLGAHDYITKPYNAVIARQRIGNIIDLRESAAMVNELSRDRLTGLYSRERFFDMARELYTQREPGYYVMSCFDIESFKIINDQFGTGVGDTVLRHIASTLGSWAQHNGGLCGRIMADNFAVLYPTRLMYSESTLKAADEITAPPCLGRPIVIKIGRCIIQDVTLSADAVYDRAALAAESIKGRYNTHDAMFDESMRDSILEEQQTVSEMESALREGQFEPWLQPQYNHSTGALIGAEALVRWRHPERGLVPPALFIPVFEKNGFIYELDKSVWEQVCALLRGWLDAGLEPLPISVNISRYDVFRDDLIDVITGLTAKYGIPVELLRLEITETAFAQSADQIIAVVRRLVELGFTVEIDDFGSGYSSLNTLKDVPAQILKLDMSFLESKHNSQRGGNILESIVRMAKWLDMAVIAEGVETIEQAEYLKSIGVSYVQGYLYARPMPAGEYEALAARAEGETRLTALQTVDNLDNNAFWNPESMDTLIFNSYIGGACIYEYCDGRIELLRANRKYIEVIGSAGMTIDDALRLEWSEHLDSENREKVLAALEASIKTSDEVTAEFVFKNLPGCSEKTYLRSAVRVIAKAGNRYLVYCTNENITAQREAESRERRVAEEMSLIMKNVNSGICAAVPEPNGDFSVVFANERFYSMFGYKEGQLEAELGGLLGAVHPEDVAKTVAIVGEVMRQGGQAFYEYRCIKRDGSVIDVSSNITLAPFPGYENGVLLAVLSDVSEKIRAESRMSRLTEQLHIIMRNVNGGISAMSVDEEGVPHIIFANDKYYSMLGYTRGQAEAELGDVREMIYPEDKEKARESIMSLLRDGKPNEVEYRGVRRDGGVIYIRSSKSMTSVEGYGDRVIISVLTDISALVLAEQREKRVNEQLQAIMRDMYGGLTAIILKNGRVEELLTNEQFYRMRGYTREQYRAELGDYFECIHPEDRERVRGEVMAAFSSEQPVRDEYRIITRDGSMRWIKASISATRFTGVEQPVVLSVFSDVTAEKNAEMTTQYALGQMRSMMDDMPGGYARLRVLPGGELKPEYVNAGYCRLTGMEHAEVMRVFGNSSFAGVHPDDVPRAREAVAEMMSSGRPQRLRYRLLRSGGEYKWVNIFTRITADTSGNLFINSYYTDISGQTSDGETPPDSPPGGAGRVSKTS